MFYAAKYKSILSLSYLVIIVDTYNTLRKTALLEDAAQHSADYRYN